MDGLFLLYALAFVPVKGAYSGVIITTRDALFMQTNIKQDFEVVKKNVEKRVPKTLGLVAGVSYKLATKKELEFKSKQFGNWNVGKDHVKVTWGFSW